MNEKSMNEECPHCTSNETNFLEYGYFIGESDYTDVQSAIYVCNSCGRLFPISIEEHQKKIVPK